MTGLVRKAGNMGSAFEKLERLFHCSPHMCWDRDLTQEAEGQDVRKRRKKISRLEG